MVFYFTEVIQVQAYTRRNLRKFILKLHSELNFDFFLFFFNLRGSAFQAEDPEKAKLVLNRSIRGRGIYPVKHSYLTHTGQELDEERHSDKGLLCQRVF